jgi:hypothetical protein
VESLLEDILVGLIVAGSTVFSAWRLMSPRLRLRTLDFAAPFMGKIAGGTLTRLRTQVIGQLAAGCSACSHNKTAVHHPSGRRG